MSKSSLLLRPLIVLDLDETLLQSFHLPKVTVVEYECVLRMAREQKALYEQKLLTYDQWLFHEIPVIDHEHSIVVQLRPYIWPFLQHLLQYYLVGIWTAGDHSYMKYVCDLLFPHNTTQPVFCMNWTDCQQEKTSWQYCQCVYTKPLNVIARKFPQLQYSTAILVDNRMENGIRYPNQLVVAPEFKERPWITGAVSKDQYLQEQCLQQIDCCIEVLQLSRAMKLLKQLQHIYSLFISNTTTVDNNNICIELHSLQ